MIPWSLLVLIVVLAMSRLATSASNSSVIVGGEFNQMSELELGSTYETLFASGMDVNVLRIDALVYIDSENFAAALYTSSTTIVIKIISFNYPFDAVANFNPAHTQRVWSMSTVVSGGYTYLLSASDDTTVKSWQIEYPVSLGTFTEHTNGVKAVVGLSNGKVASADNTNTVKIWTAPTGTVSANINVADPACALVQVAGNVLAIGTTSGKIYLKDLNTYSQISILDGETTSVVSMKLYKTNLLVVAHSSKVLIRNWQTKVQVASFSQSTIGFDITQSNKLVLVIQDNTLYTSDITETSLSTPSIVSSLTNYSMHSVIARVPISVSK